MVIDSSALLAIIFKEPLAGWVEAQMENNYPILTLDSDFKTTDAKLLMPQ